MAAQPVLFYTPKQYLEREQDAAFKSEYVSGQIFATAGDSPEHSKIANNIGGEMRGLLKRKPRRNRKSPNWKGYHDPA